MLDLDEQAAYEEWKANKMASAMDLSARAFNAEMSALAHAYDEGIDAMENSRESASALKAKSPYRRPGMTGHSARSITTEEKDEE